MAYRTLDASDARNLLRVIALLVAISLATLAGSYGFGAHRARVSIFVVSPVTGRPVSYPAAVKFSIIFTALAAACGYAAICPHHVVDGYRRAQRGRKG